MGTTTRAVTTLKLGRRVAIGQTVWLAARWMNPRGHLGPAGSVAAVRLVQSIFRHAA